MQVPEPDRRSQILEAALACFLERGYKATTIGDIRALSGASTGSIYHFFNGKSGLARALLERAVAGWSSASSEALDPVLSAQAAIKASVRGLVRWGEANAALLRFMDEIRTLALADPELAEARDALTAGQVEGQARFASFAARGEVRPLPWPVAHALMLGPAYSYLRLVGAGEQPVVDAAELLADAAWVAVRPETAEIP